MLFRKSGLDKEKKQSRRNLRANKSKTCANSDATKIKFRQIENNDIQIMFIFLESLDFVDIKTNHRKLANLAKFSIKIPVFFTL